MDRLVILGRWKFCGVFAVVLDSEYVLKSSYEIPPCTHAFLILEAQGDQLRFTS